MEKHDQPVCGCAGLTKPLTSLEQLAIIVKAAEAKKAGAFDVQTEPRVNGTPAANPSPTEK